MENFKEYQKEYEQIIDEKMALHLKDSCLKKLIKELEINFDLESITPKNFKEKYRELEKLYIEIKKTEQSKAKINNINHGIKNLSIWIKNEFDDMYQNAAKKGRYYKLDFEEKHPNSTHEMCDQMRSFLKKKKKEYDCL